MYNSINRATIRRSVGSGRKHGSVYLGRKKSGGMRKRGEGGGRGLESLARVLLCEMGTVTHNLENFMRQTKCNARPRAWHVVS